MTTSKPKAAALKGKRTYATITALATVVVAQKLRPYLPDELATAFASDVVTYVELGLAGLAMYFRAKATQSGAVEHTDTQAKPSKGPDFWP